MNRRVPNGTHGGVRGRKFLVQRNFLLLDLNLLGLREMQKYLHIPLRPLFIAGPIVAGLLFSFMNAIDALADAPEITVGKEFKRWSPIAGLSLKHSNWETDFVVYMNIDIEKYETAPQSEADVYFRINGKLRGESIVRYLAFEPELKALWDALENAR